MDQIKIGRFISKKRKEKGLTQMLLAEKLNVSDRAVSKWENGRSMPDSSIMLDLCNILGITVTDLLYGEVVTMDNYNKDMEKKLIEIVKEKERGDKQLFTLEVVIGILSMVILFTPIMIASFLPMEDWQRLVITFSGFIPAFVGFFFALRIEQVAGYYECNKCKHRYVPTYGAVTKAMHLGRTRYMKCPKCNEKSWQKKVLKLEDED